MNLKLLPVLIVLCLPACATHTVKDDSPASDVDALVANVRKTTAPTLLPNGKEYCLEDADTEDEQDACAGDLEDAVYIGNRKGEQTRKTVEDFARAERLRRNPCGFWKRTFQPASCR